MAGLTFAKLGWPQSKTWASAGCLDPFDKRMRCIRDWGALIQLRWGRGGGGVRGCSPLRPLLSTADLSPQTYRPFEIVARLANPFTSGLVHVTSCHITSHHITSHHITSHHIT